MSADQEGVFLAGCLTLPPMPEGTVIDLGALIERITHGECLICRCRVHMVEVGCCVYGDCGHRLFQGHLK